MKEDELVSQLRETDPILYRSDNYDLLSYMYETISSLNPEHKSQLVSQLGTIFRSESIREILWFFMKRKATTGKILEDYTGLPKQTIYRGLQWLRNNGFIIKVAPLSYGRRGRTSTIFAVPDYVHEDVIQATTLDRHIRMPGYAEVVRLGNLIMTEHLANTIHKDDETFLSRSKIHQIMKRECKGFRWFDLEKGVISYIKHQTGYKVM